MKSPEKLLSSKYFPMVSFCSPKTLHKAVECSFGRPSCCNSADSVASSASNRQAFTNIKRKQATADLMDFNSFLVDEKQSLNLASWKHGKWKIKSTTKERRNKVQGHFSLHLREYLRR